MCIFCVISDKNIADACATKISDVFVSKFRFCHRCICDASIFDTNKYQLCLCLRYHIIFLSQICDIPVLDIILYFSFIYHIISLFQIPYHLLVFKYIIMSLFQISHHFPVWWLCYVSFSDIILCHCFRYYIMFQISYYVLVSDIISYPCFSEYVMSIFQILYYVCLSDIISCFCFGFHTDITLYLLQTSYQFPVLNIILTPCFRYYITP